MKRIICTTAIAIMLASPAMAAGSFGAQGGSKGSFNKNSEYNLGLTKKQQNAVRPINKKKRWVRNSNLPEYKKSFLLYFLNKFRSYVVYKTK